jgi:hypothetical protein
MIASSASSRFAISSGRSSARRNGPRDVPPRMITQGIRPAPAMNCLHQLSSLISLMIHLRRLVKCAYWHY